MFSNGALTLLANRDQVSRGNLQSVCHAGLSMVYGARLTEFLYRRQFKPSYQKEMKGMLERSARSSFSKKLRVVTMVSSLMSSYIIPLMYNFRCDKVPREKQSWVNWLGCGLAAIGIILQLFSDEQKLKHKDTIGGCTMDGFYKYIRHPNFTGEFLFHIGMYLGGFSTYKNWKEKLYAAIGPGLMAYVAIGASARLDKKQMKNYGNNLEYKNWRETSWVLIPFIF